MSSGPASSNAICAVTSCANRARNARRSRSSVPVGVSGTSANRTSALHTKATPITPYSRGSAETVAPTNRDRK